MRATAFFAAFLLACSLTTPVAAQDKGPPTITVAGEGIVTARPDLATVSVSVVTQARNAQEALAQNSKLTAELIAAARQAGIAPRDLETQRILLQPQYAQPSQGSREAPRISGYEARNTLQVRVRELDKLGALLDRLTAGGGNQIGGIALSVAEPLPLLDQARTAAVKDALRKAELLAEAAGLRVVRLLAMEEAGAEVPGPLMRLAAAPARDRVAVPIEAGEQELRARVNTTFEVMPK